MIRRLAVLILVLLVALGAPAQAQNGQANGNARLNVGDILQITVPGEDAFNQPIQIDREGRVNLPEVGPVDVAGLTVAQARDRVRAALAQSFRDLGRFNLTLRERRLLLSVGGYVRTPGPVELPAGANVQQAIVAAGGLSQGAQLDRMQVRRGNEAITFDYKRFLDT
ncbi:MAG: polysaccharide biosynthesis/export family protein, partial [Roseococcus sp.]